VDCAFPHERKTGIDRSGFVLYDIHTFPKESSFGNLSAAAFVLCAESGRIGRDFIYVCGVFGFLEWKGV
jgi:hypothetical protein